MKLQDTNPKAFGQGSILITLSPSEFGTSKVREVMLSRPVTVRLPNGETIESTTGVAGGNPQYQRTGEVQDEHGHAYWINVCVQRRPERDGKVASPVTIKNAAS